MAVEKVIGNLEVRKDGWSRTGFDVICRNPITGMGIGLYLDHVTPNDLRELADYLEKHGFNTRSDYESDI